MDMLGSLNCEKTTMAIFLGCYPSEIAPPLLVHLYVYKWLCFVFVFGRFPTFFPFGSPSFLVIVPHFDLSSALSAHLDTGIPATHLKVCFGRPRPSQAGPASGTYLWHTQEGIQGFKVSEIGFSCLNWKCEVWSYMTWVGCNLRVS